ncbi:MAG: TMEM175 family protein [Bryobacteraceae bacterium]
MIPIQLSKHRIEALSDGLFAIVMTLLVLELKVPDLPRSSSNTEILAKLREIGPSFFTFGLTFMLSAMFWFLHHLAFQFTRHLTRTMVWLNLIFLMFVSLLPFSAGMLGRFLRSQTAECIYYGNLFVISALLPAQWEYAKRHRLIVDEIDPRFEKSTSERLMRIPIACAGALAAGVYNPELAFVGFAGAVAIFRLIVKVRSRNS